MITTIFLDNDGVLVDTEKYYCEANQVTCARYGYDLTRTEYQHLFLASGIGLRQVSDLLGWSDETLASIRVERDRLYGTLLQTREIVLPQVEEGLARLSNRFDLCVVTSSPRSFFDCIHERTGFSRFFRHVVSGECVTKHKPDPEPYMIALRAMRSAPENGLAVEDSNRGVQSAIGAGLRCIAAPRKLTKDQDFSGAVAVVENFTNVASVIERLADESAIARETIFQTAGF